jgi:DNA end-binding protein Ku
LLREYAATDYLLHRHFGGIMANSVWKGHITFGLISIPVRLFAAARTERISMNQLHKVCQTRVRQPLFCPVCNRQIERSEVMKGYEYEKDQYVLFNEDELDKIEPPSATTMEILEFVKLEEVDPLYFDASYYVTPEEAGKKAYQLLMMAMEESGYGAIAKLTMHQREHIVVIRPRAKGLTLHTLFYADEVRQVAEYGHSDKIEVKDAEKKLALQLIESLATHFNPEQFHDSYRQSLRAMIEAKRKGEQVVEAAHPKLAPVIDLMEALKKSLAEKPAQTPEIQPQRAAPEAVAARKRGAKRKAG